MNGALVATAVPSLALAPGTIARQAPVAKAVSNGHLYAVASDSGIRQAGLVRGRIDGPVGLALDRRTIPGAPGGSFVIGFGRDAPESATLMGRLANGSSLKYRFRVAHRLWPLHNRRTLFKSTPRTPQAIAARAAEVARVATVRPGLFRSTAGASASPGPSPAASGISGVLKSQTIYAGEPGSYHTGVDIVRPTNMPVLAPADGLVVLASPPRSSVEGNLLILDHRMGVSSAFLHLCRIDVPVGARGYQRQKLGAIIATGRATYAHLHCGLGGRRVRVDPQWDPGAMR